MSRPLGTQGLIDKRYVLLRSASLVVMSLDVFLFFACYVVAQVYGKSVWTFEGLYAVELFSAFPILLKFTLIGFAAISLPLVIHGRSLALAIEKPGKGVQEKLRRLESVESAFAYYRRTCRIMFITLSLVNIAAAAYFIILGDFLTLVIVSCIGFANKLIVFPRLGHFNRWLWEALNTVSKQPVD